MSGDLAHDPRRTVAELPDTALVVEPTTRIVLPPEPTTRMLPPGCWTGGGGVAPASRPSPPSARKYVAESVTVRPAG